MAFSVISQDHSGLRSAPDDLRAALDVLRSADLVDAETEENRRRMLAFCADHDDALHRTCLQGHLTASAAVVDPAARRTLLLHHTKLDRWLQPGGHADGDGNLAAVALREATEETGIEGLRVVVPALDVDIHRIPARTDEPEHLHLDVRFLVLAPAQAAVQLNHEALAARWVKAHDPVVDSSELRRLLDRALTVAGAL